MADAAQDNHTTEMASTRGFCADRSLPALSVSVRASARGVRWFA